MRLGRHVISGMICAALALSAAAAAAQQQGPARERKATDGPVMLNADTIRHDRELGIVVATGNVDVTQGERILKADTVTYNQREDTVSATGNIVLMEPTGEVIFADHVELTGDLKAGIIRNIRIRLTDDARIAAAGGRRVGGVRTEMSKAVYSPCRECRDDPGRAPIWQLKAARIIHDQKAKEVEYRDVFLEIFGMPVAYTPYLSHPDPTVKRKSGLLAPTYGSDSELGLLLSIPYYFVISPDKDATLTPTVVSKEGVGLAGEYRQRFASGKLKVSGSGIDASVEDNGEPAGDDIRGHFFGATEFHLDETWRAGARVELTSDDTYLRRFKITSRDSLVNHGYVEGFRGRNYAAANTYYFRGLREEDDTDTTPLILPILDYNFVGEPGAQGGRWNLDANLMNLTRSEGADSRRLSLKTGWQLPRITAGGEVYNLYASLQTDAYWVNDVQEPGKPAGSLSDGVTGRIVPKLGIDWRMPFVRNEPTVMQIIEPVAGIVVAPNGGNPGIVPNEDSSNFELDDTNVMSPNRFPGLDRVDGGQRLYYGLKWGVYGAGGGFTNAFIGQSYSIRTDDSFTRGSGLDDHFSDITGMVGIQPKVPIQVNYRFRLDKDDLTPRRNELQTSLGPPALSFGASYVFIDESGGSEEFADREELTSSISSKITDNWSVSASNRRNLGPDSGSLSNLFSVVYSDDCFTMNLTASRSFTQDRDLKPTDTIFVRLFFKTLGEVTAATDR